MPDGEYPIFRDGYFRNGYWWHGLGWIKVDDLPLLPCSHSGMAARAAAFCAACGVRMQRPSLIRLLALKLFGD